MKNYLIVGLGNPTAEYDGTRHNIGFRMVDALASLQKWSWEVARHGDVARGRIKNAQITLLKPSTYMNLSGTAVRYWLQEANVPMDQLLVCVDDLALPYATLRLKPGGSDGGHNGLKHITQLLGSNRYARLRCGIGSDYPRGKQIEYVLGHFSEGEEAEMSFLLARSCEMIESFCLAGVDRTMNTYNNKPLHPEE